MGEGERGVAVRRERNEGEMISYHLLSVSHVHVGHGS